MQNPQSYPPQPNDTLLNRTLTSPPVQHHVLIGQRSRSGSPWVFPSPVNREKPRSSDSLYRIWKLARKQAGIEDVRLHDLRHSVASQAVLKGVPLPVVARLLGHSQVSMTLRYAHVAETEVEAAAERVGRVIADLCGISYP